MCVAIQKKIRIAQKHLLILEMRNQNVMFYRLGDIVRIIASAESIYKQH